MEGNGILAETMRMRSRPSSMLRGVAAACLAITGFPASAAPFIYVAVLYDDKVAVVDMATDTVIADIPVDHFPMGAAANAIGTRVYVGSDATSAVTVIDTITNTVATTIPTSASPSALVFDPVNSRLYVQDAAGIEVVDTTTNHVAGTIDGIESSPGCESLVANHAGNRIYATGADSSGAGSIWVIDAATSEVIRNVPLAFAYPCALVVSPDDATVYVTPGVSPLQMGALDTSDYSLGSVAISAVALDSSFAIDPSGSPMYVPDGYLVAIDFATNHIEALMSLAPQLFEIPYRYSYGVMIDPAHQRLYVANSESNTLTVEDLAANVYLHAITVGLFPHGLAKVSIIDEIFEGAFDQSSE
jgi:YVTN family beta-propeller protein